MHTFLVITGGFALLGICLLTGKICGGSSLAMARAALVFLPLWFLGAGINLWVGVAKAGYTFQEELPIFCVVFGGPATAAALIWCKCKPA